MPLFTESESGAKLRIKGLRCLSRSRKNARGKAPARSATPQQTPSGGMRTIFPRKNRSIPRRNLSGRMHASPLPCAHSRLCPLSDPLHAPCGPPHGERRPSQAGTLSRTLPSGVHRNDVLPGLKKKKPFPHLQIRPQIHASWRIAVRIFTIIRSEVYGFPRPA